jgi:hypothetical protein
LPPLLALRLRSVVKVLSQAQPNVPVPAMLALVPVMVSMALAGVLALQTPAPSVRGQSSLASVRVDDASLLTVLPLMVYAVMVVPVTEQWRYRTRQAPTR